MKTQFLSINLLVIFILGVSTSLVKAQSTSDKEQILLSGKVNCINPLNGALSLVVVFNKSKGNGAISKLDGSFSIKMSKSDTIVFSTAEHQDYIYYLDANEKFEDHSIDVVMITDAVWLNVVTVMGVKNLEQFKQEILSLNIPQGNTTLALPVVNKYAKQLSTGVGETDLVGPLTYLLNKFNKYYRMEKKVNK